MINDLADINDELLTLDLAQIEKRIGYVVEYAATEKIFTNPDNPRGAVASRDACSGIDISYSSGK